MKENNHPFSYTVLRTLAIAAVLASFVLTSVQAGETKASPEDRVETRITELHSKIHITPAQENQWGKVAQVMRDNAKRQGELFHSRMENAKTLTAVEEMKSYAEISAAHADGAQQLIPVFETLYASMSDAQKKQADEAFHHGHGHHHGKHGHH